MAINLRKEARGRDCQVRYAGVCNGNPETVILAHPNEKSVFGAGISMKPDDMFGAHCCSACHDVYDGRVLAATVHPDWDLKIMFYEGVFRTQNILLEEGKL